MFEKAKKYRDEMITSVDDFDEFQRVLDEKGGFVLAHWDGTVETEKRIKELSKATARCIPLDSKPEAGKCVLTGEPSTQRVLFARAY
jgi:prolyl-tRNA synthetase